MSAKAIKLQPAYVIVRRRQFREEWFYSASVWLAGRICFEVSDGASEQGVCLDVLDWGQRQGKKLEWEYVR